MKFLPKIILIIFNSSSSLFLLFWLSFPGVKDPNRIMKYFKKYSIFKILYTCSAD